MPPRVMHCLSSIRIDTLDMVDISIEIFASYCESTIAFIPLVMFCTLSYKLVARGVLKKSNFLCRLKEEKTLLTSIKMEYHNAMEKIGASSNLKFFVVSPLGFTLLLCCFRKIINARQKYRKVNLFCQYLSLLPYQLKNPCYHKNWVIMIFLQKCSI